MRKRKNKLGENIYVFQVPITVNCSRFCLALTDHFSREGENFDSSITKKAAKKILINELKWYGQQGEHTDGFFEAAYEIGELRNSIFAECEKWVIKNYPYLKRNPSNINQQ